MKDNFSGHAREYQLFRPRYPEAFYSFLFNKVKKFHSSWDCGTGNGQVATVLARHFQHVLATDISQKQLDNAATLPNISYSVARAENTNFPNNHFNLITAGQAAHWFDLPAYYDEVRRVAYEGAVIALFGYGLIRISPTIDQLIDHLYFEILNKYWDPERRLVDDHYRSIPFPFQEHQVPSFQITLQWELKHLSGYLETWSAVKHYQGITGNNPLTQLQDHLQSAWGNKNSRQVTFPMFARIGIVS